MSTDVKLTYFYGNVPLGVLEKTEGGYVYTSYTANEEMLQMRGHLYYSEYGLWHSYKRESKKLFPDMENVIDACSRSDIQERAGICPEDSRWKKLVKLSRLKFFPSGFYVQPTKDMEEESNYHLTPRTNATDSSSKFDDGW